MVRKLVMGVLILVIASVYAFPMGFLGLIYETREECKLICEHAKMEYRAIDIHLGFFGEPARTCMCRGDNNRGLDIDIDWYHELRKAQQELLTEKD